MTKSRWSYLAIAVFTLAVQVAAAAHAPVHDEPVSKCRDNGAHFCAETVEPETGSCVLCHVSLNGVFLDQPAPQVATLRSEAVLPEASAPSEGAAFLAAHAPRGPPVG